jgi:hypothetical protein
MCVDGDHFHPLIVAKPIWLWFFVLTEWILSAPFSTLKSLTPPWHPWLFHRTVTSSDLSLLFWEIYLCLFECVSQTHFSWTLFLNDQNNSLGGWYCPRLHITSWVVVVLFLRWGLTVLPRLVLDLWVQVVLLPHPPKKLGLEVYVTKPSTNFCLVGFLLDFGAGDVPRSMPLSYISSYKTSPVLKFSWTINLFF